LKNLDKLYYFNGNCGNGIRTFQDAHILLALSAIRTNQQAQLQARQKAQDAWFDTMKRQSEQAESSDGPLEINDKPQRPRPKIKSKKKPNRKKD
jgi:hypothetical protein